MNKQAVPWLMGAVAWLVLFYMSYQFRADQMERLSRAGESAAKFKEYLAAVPVDAPSSSSEPLLVRLQDAVKQARLEDRVPKIQSVAGAPGLPPNVELKLEGADGRQIGQLLLMLGAHEDMTLVSFGLTRIGDNSEKFDLQLQFAGQ